MSATSGGGGSVSDGSEAGGSSQSTMSINDSPSTSFQTNLPENVTKITLSEENIAGGGYGIDMTGSRINLSLDERQQKDGIVNVAFDFEEGMNYTSSGAAGGIGGGTGTGIAFSGISAGGGKGAGISSNGGMGAGISSSGGMGAGISSGGGKGAGISSSGGLGAGISSGGGMGAGISAGGGKGAGISSGGGKGAGISSSGGLGAGISSGGGMGAGISAGGGKGAGISSGGGMGAGSGMAAGGGMGVSGGGGGAGGGSAVGVGAAAGAGGAVGVGGAGVEFKLINGSEKKDKVPEAVNLELVNMVPYSNGNGTSYGVPVNGIPMKKDSEQVDVSSPYDEYFVPVNEHKKYMRGEKLYVTKDKRRPTSWRRCLSWIVACTVISVVLIVAILAGTGVILSEPSLVKEASVGRNFAGSNSKPSVTDKSPTPTAEMLMYVPRSIESEFVIDNLNFDPALKDVNSTAYRQFATSMEDQLKMLLFDKETLDFGASDVALKIVNISRDPFKVNYRIGWNYKEGANNPPEPIKMEDVKKRLVESLARNQGYIDKYHIDREAIKVNHVVNACQIENGGCSHICYYNYITQKFTCTCPTHLVLDNNGRNCVAWTGSSEDDAAPVPSHAAYPEMPNESTIKPSHEQELGAHYEHGVQHGVHHQHDSEQEPTPEPKPQDHEPVAEPEPTAEPGPDHQDGSFYSKSEHGETVHSVHDGQNRGTEDATAEHESEDKYHVHGQPVHGFKEPEAEPTPEPAPEPTAEPSSEGKDAASWHGIKDHEPAAEPTPEPAPEPTAGDSSEGRSHGHSDHSIYGFKDHEPAAEPTPEPTAEPTPEEKDHDHSDHTLYGSKDHEPAAEPTPEPEVGSESRDHDHGHHHDHHYSVYGVKDESEPESTAEPAAQDNERDHEGADRSVYESKEHETATEPNRAGMSHETDVHSVYESKEQEPAVETTTEPVAEPTAEENDKGVEHKDREVAQEQNPLEKSHDADLHSVPDGKDHEPAAEPTPEPTAEPSADGKDHDHVNLSLYGTKDHEPAAEPTPEPTPEPGTDGKDHDHVNHSLDGSKEHEPAAEPTPEPTPEPGSDGKDQYQVTHSLHGSSEPGSDGKNPDHVNHSLYGQKDHEVEAEATPEPAPEPTAEPGSDEKEHDYVNHSLHGSNDQSTPESATERDYKEGRDSAGLSGSPQEGVAEPTAEPTPEDGDHGVGKDSKDHEAAPEPTPEPGTDSELSHGNKEIQGTRPSESVSESSAPNGDSITHFNSDTGYTFGTTIHPVQGREGTVSNSSVMDHHSVPSQEEMTGARTENPAVDGQTDSATETSRPHLEDILIRKPSQDSNQNGQRQNPLDNVELNANGEPVIEDVVIKKSGSERGNGSDLPQTPAGNEGVDNAHPHTHPDGSGMRFFPTDQRSNAEGETVSPVIATDNPRIVEYSAVEDSTKDGRSDDKTEKSTVLGGGQDPSQTSQNFGVHHVTTTERNQEVVTEHDVEQESHTIPVTIEFLHPTEEKREGQIKMPKTGEESPEYKSSSNPAGVNEEPIIRVNDPSKVLIGGGSDETRTHKTTTESRVGVTTLSPVLTRDENNREGVSGESFKQSRERGETTKSPEEISNNIKDELLENEEFNTLIDHEYSNKEGGPNDSKYVNKPAKTEKKKIKDYVKGDKIEQKGEATPRPAVTPAEFILQKHVNGNDHILDLDYSLQNEHTTKHEGGVTVVDPHGIDVPGVSLKPHGINNHDISVLQTVAPDFRTETLIPTGGQEPDAVKSESKNKDGDLKLDKDYSKFDKDYKYEKQKVSKKKDLKKKVGGKDGKNVELEDGRKYFADTTRDDLEISSEEIPETTANAFGKEPAEGSAQPGDGGVFETRTELAHSANGQAGPETSEQTGTGNNQQTHNAPTDKSGHLMVDEPIVKSTSDTSSETVHDGQGHIPGAVRVGQPEIRYEVKGSADGVPGTVFDGMSPQVSGFGGGQNGSFVIYENTGSKIVTDGNAGFRVVNSSLIHPTIVFHGQNENLQGGHFGNGTVFRTGNATIMRILNGTLNHPNGQSFSYFSNGSTVNPTIAVRGQSGTLQGGHEIRFGNVTYRTVLSPETQTKAFKNSNVYRIENGSLPGTVFDGHFNPQEGHYHMFTNASGLFVYSNASAQPEFFIRGQSGDFGNSKAYVIRNNTGSFSTGFLGPHSVIFRNSTVFAVGDVPGAQPHELTSNETIQYTHQMSPSFVSSGTAYKVNDYFGYISKCAAGQFQCLNGTSKRGSACISLSSKCDSINDCSDGSDELGCIENGCPGNFQCSDSTCLKRNLVCNGILDCSDGSDEKNCESWKCEFDEFQCPSGRCIPVVWQCDNKPDCDNHTDEYNCQTSCGNDEYLCPEGWCIPLTYKCNGVKDCSNGEDEQLCDCSHEEFKCQTGGCVSMNHVCNGLEDCPDRSDEWDCVKLEPETNLLKIRSATGNYEPVCADNWTTKFSDEVCASLGYFSSVPIENENSSITTDTTSFYVLKNDTTAHFNKKIIVNLRKSEGNCSSGKLVEISCQEFSCGSRSMTDSSSVEARLVGGMSAAAGQWPSVALLYNVRNFHSCTANILTPRWVLASYNCLKMGNKNINQQDWKFFGGSTVFEPEKENQETRKILQIIPHPQVKFNQFLFSNDLALVEVDQSLQFTSSLGAVCLPEQELQPRQICVTAGWGMNTPEDKAIRQQLQYLPVPTINLTECNSTEHYAGFITEDKICAGYNSPQKSLCYNEEGAPLMCVNNREEWELQGVLSYHSNCGRGSHPSIFSSITPVSDWIRKTIGNSFERKALPVTKR